MVNKQRKTYKTTNKQSKLALTIKIVAELNKRDFFLMMADVKFLVVLNIKSLLFIINNENFYSNIK